MTAPAKFARWIVHVDMDAYYASIEQRDRPALRGRPVVVGGSPFSRAVVCAASYEARRFGVRSAMPCAQARRLCPDLVFVAPDFQRYSAEAQRIRALFAEVSERVEPLSLDEAHLDISTAVARGTHPAELAAGLRERIRSVTGLIASAGIAPNKFLAKAASDRAKPDGLLLVGPGEVSAFVSSLPITAIPGIGPVTARRCHDLGLVGAVDLLRLDAIELQAHFGSAGAWFAACARGEDDRPVIAEHERKSVGIEDTFASDLTDPAQLRERLHELAAGLARRLAAAGVRGRTLTLKVKYHDFIRTGRSRTFPEPLGDAGTLELAAIELLRDTAAGRVPIRLLGLSCSHLDRLGAVQQTLF
ncbi:MAG: DNA polymerase IV [Planctomycetes bacterium]|nr:DNA polymerase IV [Planctomycetota bacterium]